MTVVSRVSGWQKDTASIRIRYLIEQMSIEYMNFEGTIYLDYITDMTTNADSNDEYFDTIPLNYL